MADDVKAQVEEELEGPPEPPAGPRWEYKKEFAITGSLRDVVQKTIKATEAEIASLHRKLNKLTYGS